MQPIARESFGETETQHLHQQFKQQYVVEYSHRYPVASAGLPISVTSWM